MFKLKQNQHLHFGKMQKQDCFATTPILLVIVACMGGIAAAYGIKESVYQLGLITFPAATVLAMILSLAPMRAITITSTVSVLLSLLVILF